LTEYITLSLYNTTGWFLSKYSNKV